MSRLKKLDKNDLDTKTRAVFELGFEWACQTMKEVAFAIDHKRQLNDDESAIDWPLVCNSKVDDNCLLDLAKHITGLSHGGSYCKLINIKDKLARQPNKLDKFFILMHFLGHAFIYDLGYQFDHESYQDIAIVESSLIIFAAMATYHYTGIDTISPYMLTEWAYTISDLVQVENKYGQKYTNQEQVNLIEALYVHLLLRDQKGIFQ